MPVDKLTLQLFYPFPREVSRGRKIANTASDFLKYVEQANGREDVFISTLPLDGYIDRAHFDLDGPRAIQDAKRLYLWGTSEDFCTIPIATGIKGFQIHILSRPFKLVNNKEILSDIETYILSKALGIKNWDDQTSIDWHLFGNVSSLCRVPNTLRPPDNLSYASYLPPNFPEMSEREIFSYTKSPHVFDYHIHHHKSLLDLPYTSDPEPIKSTSFIEPSVRHTFSSDFKPSDSVQFLSNLLSPRRLTQITQSNPPHNVRIVTTLELLDCGLSIQELVNVYSKLGWHDYNEFVTRGQVTDLADRYYKGEYKLRRPD